MSENEFRRLPRTTWTKVEESVKTRQVTKTILPIGSLEQHGPHLPLSTDTILAEYVAGQVFTRCEGTFLMPPIHIGCSGEHIGFAGTISMQPRTMANLLFDISQSLLKSGLKKIFIINGHGGNRTVIDGTIMRVKQSLPEMQLYAFTILDIAKDRFEQIRKSVRRLVGHADEIETSMMLAIHPESVDMSKAAREEPTLPKPLSFELEDMARVSFSWKATELTKSGVIGDPSLSSLETGKDLLEFVTNVISEAINQL